MPSHRVFRIQTGSAEMILVIEQHTGVRHVGQAVELSIVGAGMMSNPGVAAKMFESLYNEGVNINMISTSEIRVTVLINEKDGVRAMNAVHDAFGLAD